MRVTSAFFIILIAAYSCNNRNETAEQEKFNPPAEGFNLKNSDPEAIALADRVMLALGGRKSYDNIRFIKWNFGRRDLLWDKSTGNVRINIPSDSTIFLVNVQQDTGSVYINGKKITDMDSLKKLITQAKSIWINDSYWLVMPFKLKDSGVTLKHLGQDTLPSGQEADVLELTFEGVGVTPQNKYEIFIDKSDNLVKQWAYFAKASQEEPSAVWPWDNYKNIAGVKFSYNRSDGRGPKDLEIYSNVPIEAFTSPDKPDFPSYSRLSKQLYK